MSRYKRVVRLFIVVLILAINSPLNHKALLKGLLVFFLALWLGGLAFWVLVPGPAQAQGGNPQADFRGAAGSPVRGTVPLTLTFVNSSTNAASYVWDFGDGETSTVISPTHVYSQTGHYTVTLVVTSTEGITDVEIKPAYVTVSPEPTTTLDLDQDGYTDLVVSNYYNGSYNINSYIYWGSAAGYHPAMRAQLPTVGAVGNAVADLDNDGDLDIVLANYAGDSYLYWGNGSRNGFNSSNRLVLPTAGAHAVAVADLNEDGYLDLVFANYSGSQSYLYWGSGSGYSSSRRATLPTAGAVAVELADLNKDGYVDIVFANYSGSNSYIYWGAATGYATSTRTDLPTANGRDVEVGDVNQDGHFDLVFANYEGTNSYIYWGNGTPGGFSPINRQALPTLGGHGVAVVDLDRDGHQDVALANHFYSGRYDLNSYIYWGSSSGLSATNRLELPTLGATGLIAADLDRDGWSDLVFASYYDGASYSSFSRVYWNSPAGFNLTNLSLLPGLGSEGVSAAWPGEGNPSAFGQVLPQLGHKPTTALALTVPADVNLLEPAVITVTAHLSSGNVATNYTGQVVLTATGGTANSFPASHTFSPADQGVYAFTGLLFEETGPQTLVISDGSLTDTVVVTVTHELVTIAEDTTWPEINVSLGTLVVTGTDAVLSLQGSTTISAENIIVGPGARVSANGQGHSTSGASRRGGSHGGWGGNSNSLPYGSVSQPVTLGGGGDNGNWGTIGGRGGGAIRLIVSDTLTLLAGSSLSANGNDNQANALSSSGAGAGGSIWIDTQTIAGTGTIQAKGGVSHGTGFGAGAGSGAGGRIALYYTTYAFSGMLQTFGGNQNAYGGPGTVYQYDRLTGASKLLVDNNGFNGPAAGLTEGSYEFGAIDLRRYGHLMVIGAGSTLTLNSFSGEAGTILTSQGDVVTSGNLNVYSTTLDIQGELIDAADITINNGGQLKLQAGSYPTGTLTLDELDILSGTLTLASYDSGDTNYDNDYGFTLEANYVTISKAGRIDATGLGYALSRGRGAHNSGASYGGYGGGNVSPYGSIHQPLSLGSSGDNGRGGGAIRLVVTDTLTLNGQVQANGLNDGSGGSIWLQTVNLLTGTGQLQASGGNSGGGGGRIAVYASNNQTNTANYQANFGGGSCPQTPISRCKGSIYLDSVSPISSTVEVTPLTLIANGTSTGTVTITLRSVLGDFPVPNKEVILNVSPETGAYINGQPVLAAGVNIGPTQANGLVTATITSIQSGLKGISARTSAGETISQTAMMTFIPGPVDAALSQIAIIGNDMAGADGVDTVAIQVAARDVYSNPIPNALVTLTSNDPVHLPAPLLTDAAGQAAGLVTSTQVGLAQIGAIITDSYHSIVANDTVTAAFAGIDLNVSVSAPASVTAGYPITYYLAVANQGFLTATNVVVTGTLPDGVEFVSSSGSHPYSQIGNQIVWQLGELGPGQNGGTFSLTGTVSPTAPAALINQVTVTADGIELDLSDNSQTVSTTVIPPSPLLTVSPTYPTLPVIQGQTGSSIITVRNGGSGIMTDTVVVLPPTLPAWVTVGQTNLGDILPGQAVTFTVIADADSVAQRGHYRDILTVQAAHLFPEYVLLDVLVEGPTRRDVQLTVTSNGGAVVAGANVILTEDILVVTEGQSAIEKYYRQGVTDQHGRLSFLNVEAEKTYSLNITAHNHQGFTGPLTVSNDTGVQRVNRTLIGLPALTVLPERLEFGLARGSLSQKELTLRNPGALTLTNISLASSRRPNFRILRDFQGQHRLDGAFLWSIYLTDNHLTY